VLARLFCAVIGALPGGGDRVSTRIFASVSEDLERVAVRVRSELVPAEDGDSVWIVLAADRYRRVPPGMRPSEEREVFGYGHSFGGFDDVQVSIDGRPCAPVTRELADGGRALVCEASARKGRALSVAIEGALTVPERYGTFGRHDRQLTLAAGWYPYVAMPGRAPPRGSHRVHLELPAETGAAIGHVYFAPKNDPRLERLKIEAIEDDVAQVPLVVVSPTAHASPIDVRRAVFVSARGGTADDFRERTREQQQIFSSVQDAMLFLEDERFLWGSKPLLVVEAPLRHDLAAAADGMILLSDRAFRMFPLDRLNLFHRFPLLREVFTLVARERLRRETREAGEGLLGVSADALGAWMLDRYVRARFGGRESAFDVLGFWSFIPSVDLLLYAPDLPFQGAYFHGVDEEDPLRFELVDYPLQLPRGRIIFEKLYDRIGRERTSALMSRVLQGEPLGRAVTDELGAEGRPFLETWLGPYPSVRYRLAAHASAIAPASFCGKSPCFMARVEIERDGAPIAEPIQVRLMDANGIERLLWTETTSKAMRAVTATLGAELVMVEIDPNERLHETATDDDPSPRIDNRWYGRPCSARTPEGCGEWKTLLNSWNLAIGATAGTLDTVLDVGFERTWDVHWAYAVAASYDPAAIALETRASYGFGTRITPAQLAHRVGVIAVGQFLRPHFGTTTESALAASGALYYAYETRQTLWAPEAGESFRLTLEYDHVFGKLIEETTTHETRVLTEDSLRITANAVKSWRIGGRHTLSLRGNAGTFLYGTPRQQLLYPIGGALYVRGYPVDARLGKVRGIASAEWVHPIFAELDENAFYWAWASGLDGALFADGAVIADDITLLGSAPFLADVGYGFRLYLDYLGVRPGLMSIDIALPLFDVNGHPHVGPPAVYIYFARSF
jgi:hypothetical protein